MNIVVVLRAVQDPAGLMVNRRAHKVFVNREAYRLNPSDHNALEAALALGGEEHPVTVIGYGGAPAEDVLREALAAGAARALWVKAAALGQADGAVLARVMQCAVDSVGGADLVLFGSEVLDEDLAQVAPRLAAAQEAAYLGAVYELRISAEGRVQTIVRRGGEYRWVEAEGPAVAAVALDSNRPRYAPAARLISVYSSPEAVEVVTPEALGLTEDELRPRVERKGEVFPPEREMGTVLEGTPEATAARVAVELRRYSHEP